MEPPGNAIIILALDTLGSFDFSGWVLSGIVQECTLKYMDHESVDIRKSCIVTCCKLLANDPICFQNSNNALKVVTQILEKLLLAAVTDEEPSIRSTVLSSLNDERFDRHLAYSENIRCLFFALNDQTYAIREIATEIIGRIAFHNPGYVMPSLRKVLILLLTEIEHSNIV